MTHDELEAFLVIQEQDVHIARLNKELQSLPELRERIVKRLQAARNRTADSKKHVVELEQQIQATEHDTGTKRQYLSKLKIQQGETRNNDEYQRFNAEIAKAEQQIDELETRELELMEQLDEERKQYAVTRDKLTALEREVEEELARFDHTAGQDKERLADMKAKRAQSAAPVNPETLELYERMAKSKGLPVIVSMNDEGQCTGCHMSLTQAVKSRVMAGRGEIVACENCGRLLY